MMHQSSAGTLLFFLCVVATVAYGFAFVLFNLRNVDRNRLSMQD